MQHTNSGRTNRLWPLPGVLMLGWSLLVCSQVASAQTAGGESSGPGASDPGPKPSAQFTATSLDEPMAAVKFEGNTTIPDETMAKHIKTRPGQIVTAKQIKDDVDALVRTRWFATVEPTIVRTGDGNILVFQVFERPIVRRVEYTGNKKIKTTVFEQLTQLKPGQPYDVSVNRECARQIQDYYHEKGYPFATVELGRGDDRSDPNRKVVFLIVEGPKVKVTATKFEGNEAVSGPVPQMKTRAKTRILWMFGGKYASSTINDSIVNDDVEDLRNYYYSLGYFDVQITPEQKFSADRSTVELHFQVNEGVRYRVNEISIVGNNVFKAEEIRSLMKVKPGEEYNELRINNDVEAVMAKYGAEGRLFAQVTPVRRWSEEAGVLDLVYRINEDKVYRIRNIGIHIASE